MTDNTFIPNKEVKALVNTIFNAATTAEAEQALATAATLESDARAYIATQVEANIVRTFMNFSAQNIRQARTMAFTLADARVRGDFELINRVMEGGGEGMSTFSRLIVFIAENKGEDASAFVKAYAAEAAKLSDAEYTLPENQLLALCNASEKAQGISATASPKANPFRKSGPGM